jgi:hypothetical protein
VTDAWAAPRPILVGVGSLLLVAAGVVQLLVVTVVVSTIGPAALVLGVPVALLGTADVVFGWRIRSRRDRRAALLAASLTLLSAPFTIGVGVLGLTTILSSMIGIVALARHRDWFELPVDSEPATDRVGAPSTGPEEPERPTDEVSDSERS